jgi:hypothetical protein
MIIGLEFKKKFLAFPRFCPPGEEKIVQIFDLNQRVMMG